MDAKGSQDEITTDLPLLSGKKQSHLNCRLQMLTNKPDLGLNELTLPLPSPRPYGHLDLTICCSIEIKTWWPKQSCFRSISTVKLFRRCHRLPLIACLLWSCTGQCSVMPASVFWKKRVTSLCRNIYAVCVMNLCLL